MPLFPSVSKVGICACVVLLGCFIMAVDGTSCRIWKGYETFNANLDECVDSCKANYDNCTTYAYQMHDREDWTYYPAVDIDDCASEPCAIGETCSDKVDGHTCECDIKYLVSGSDPVEDSALTSTGYVTVTGDLSHSEKSARLTSFPTYDDMWRAGSVSVGSWVSQNVTGVKWIQVELKRDEVIKAVATRGRPQDMTKQWVKTYNVSVSTDGTNWTHVLAENGQATFDGNTDPYSVVEKKLETPTVARFVRIYPIQYHAWIAMAFDLRGCSLAYMQNYNPQEIHR